MYEFTANGPAMARIRVPGGRCAVRVGKDPGITVRVAPAVPWTKTNRLAADNTAVTYEDGILAVTTSGDGSGAAVLRSKPSVRLDVVLPAGSMLAFDAESADLDVHGSLAGLTADTGSGDVVAEDVTGDVRLDSTSGDVRLGRVGGSLSFTTHSGDLRVRSVGGSVHGNSSNGEAYLGTTEGDVQFDSESGDVHISAARGGAIRVTTSSGDVTVGVEDGIGVFQNLKTGSGDRHGDLAHGAPACDGAPALTLDVTTGSGDIAVRRV
ncbi:DUF4097 family beta strand repeat-containing protein [Streptomyces sp. NPDC002521]